jgi:hypothetical protein
MVLNRTVSKAELEGVEHWKIVPNEQVRTAPSREELQGEPNSGETKFRGVLFRKSSIPGSLFPGEKSSEERRAPEAFSQESAAS